jgi:hypothetical protein
MEGRSALSILAKFGGPLVISDLREAHGKFGTGLELTVVFVEGDAIQSAEHQPLGFVAPINSNPHPFTHAGCFVGELYFDEVTAFVCGHRVDMLTRAAHGWPAPTNRPPNFRLLAPCLALTISHRAPSNQWYNRSRTFELFSTRALADTLSAGGNTNADRSTNQK